MSVAVCLLAYSLVITVLGPPLLRKTSRAGAIPRLGIAGWVVAMSSVLGSWLLAVVLFTLDLVRGWGHLGRLLAGCLAALRALFTGGSGGIVQVGLALLAALAVAAMTARAVRGITALRHSRTRTQAHADAAVLAARGAPRGPGGALVVDGAHPSVYCLASRPHAIVITRGALEVLDEAHLGAVLAHERAHLRGRHHYLLALTRALAKVMSGLVLFTEGANEVARLLEMCADDAAARRHGNDTVVDALIALTLAPPPGATTPTHALGAAGIAVADRVERLLFPSSTARARIIQSIALGLLLLGPLLAIAMIVTQSSLCFAPVS
jgi:Zn-dependent protease with chaperone function